MSKKIPIATPKPPALSSAFSSTFAPVLERRALAIAIAVIALATLRIALNWSNMSLTWDEPGHMACGLQYLTDHVYKYEAQHPPLARLASALGPFLSGARSLHGANQDQEGVNVIFQNGPQTTVNLMRMGMLPFFILAAFSVFLWTRRHFGAPTAALATLLFTLTPTVLAHAGVATTDMPLAGCLTAAFFLLLLWAEQPTWKHSVLLGLLVALSVTSKFTALGFFPVATLFALIAWMIVARPGMGGIADAVKPRAVPFLVVVATGVVAVFAVYSFHIAPFFDGISFALYHNSRGHAAYFMGEIRNTGWWYFFPVLLGVKTPLGLLALTAIGIAVCWSRRARVVYWLPLAFAMGILLPSMTSHVNIGLRHILPIFAPIAILGAVGLMALLQRAKWTELAAAAVVIWIALSGALQHPDYLAYFNELGGGPPPIVVDSDLDWGQNTIQLARRLKELGATDVAFTDLNLSPTQLQIWPGLPRVHLINPLVPTVGWTAVSPSIWMLRRYGLSFKDARQPWFVYTHPQEKVGSLWLYYVPPR